MTQLRVGQVALIVRDYDEAIAFYCDKLGFTLIEDTKHLKKRWVRVGSPKPPGGTEILLSRAETPEQAAVIGRQAGGRVFLFLSTEDFEADFQRLRAAGVRFTEEPRTEAYGKVAVFKDLYGNRIDLIGAVGSR